MTAAWPAPLGSRSITVRVLRARAFISLPANVAHGRRAPLRYLCSASWCSLGCENRPMHAHVGGPPRRNFKHAVQLLVGPLHQWLHRPYLQGTPKTERHLFYSKYFVVLFIFLTIFSAKNTKGRTCTNVTDSGGLQRAVVCRQ